MEVACLVETLAVIHGTGITMQVSGQPFRLRHLRRALEHIATRRDAVWITTAGAIAEHWITTRAAPGTDRA